MNKFRRAAAQVARSAAVAALALGLLAGHSGVAAGSADARLSVTATVLTHASLKVLSQPSSVVITAVDIARGFVDVPSHARIAIKSNSLAGYVLEFASQGELVRLTQVKGLSSDVQLGAGGGVVMQAATGRSVSNTTMELGFRFHLMESVQPGVYAWPMQMSVVPL